MSKIKKNNSISKKVLWEWLVLLFSVVFLVGTSSAATLMPYLEVVRINYSKCISPLSVEWNKAPSVVVPLNIQSYSVKKVQLKALMTKKFMYIRLKWRDNTKNDRIMGPNQFYDGCAVSFPVKKVKGYPPSVCMGQIGNEVNIWHWRANMKMHFAENLIAGGPGTLTRSPDRYLHQDAVWRNGYWYVEFFKPLNDHNSVVFKPHHKYYISVAIWNGSDHERAMMKAVSNWIEVRVK